MSLFGRLFGKKESANEAKNVEIRHLEAAANKWGVPVLDLRPVTQESMSFSEDPVMAQNAVSYGGEDGQVFLLQEPEDKTIIPVDIRFPIDRLLAPGVLFSPSVMEHKWAIFFHRDRLLFIRGWLRRVFVVATTRQEGDTLIVDTILGNFTGEPETPEFTAAVLRYLLLSHAQGMIIPAPLRRRLEDSPHGAASWAFSVYGKLAHFGTFDCSFVPVTTPPLRTHSLLHIATAKEDVAGLIMQVKMGVPVDLLAGDGLAPLHWSVVGESTTCMEMLLQEGADPNMRSTHGATPLMNAVQGNKEKHLRMLLHWEADVNAQDNRGFTALHRAAERGLLDMVEVLLENGADKTIETKGYTALSLAKGGGHEQIVKRLEQ